MTKPLILIIDAQTGEEVTREMNAAEFAQYEIDQAAYLAKQAEAAAKATQRQALLSRLGITEEEASILLGGS